jgi:hypothetical protein
VQVSSGEQQAFPQVVPQAGEAAPQVPSAVQTDSADGPHGHWIVLTFDGWHWAHALLTQATSAKGEPDAHPGGAFGAQALVQSLHAAPSLPQAVSGSSVRQVPVASQQPLGHVTASQQLGGGKPASARLAAHTAHCGTELASKQLF